MISPVDDQANLVALAQAVIPRGLQAVVEVLEVEVTRLVDERYSRTEGGRPMSGPLLWMPERLSWSSGASDESSTARRAPGWRKGWRKP